MEQRNKIIFIIVIILLIATAIFLLWNYQPAAMVNQEVNDEITNNNQQPPIDDDEQQNQVQEVIIDQPVINGKISSPVKIVGKIKGSWFFEASLPIKIVDNNGQVLGAGTAQALTDWMTAEFVDFSAEINFLPPGTTTGKIIFEADNPSGDPQRAKSYELPITF